jgi:hypothetical protein
MYSVSIQRPNPILSFTGIREILSFDSQIDLRAITLSKS